MVDCFPHELGKIDILSNWAFLIGVYLPTYPRGK